MRARLCVALVAAAVAGGLFGRTRAATWTYAGRVLNQTQWDAVIDAAATEIIANAAYDADCGTVIAYEASAVNGPAGSVALDLPSRIPHGTHASLTRNVFSTEHARLACTGYWPCNAVQTFTLPGTSALVAVYYGAMDVTDLSGYGNLVDDGGDEEVDYTRWVATVVLDRLQGYACPAGKDVVDPHWFYATWAGRFTGVDGLVDVREALGVAADTVLTTQDITAVAANIEAYFNAFGHAHRMWPTPNCSLTPVLRRPDTGCIAAACAPNTICPSGFRLRSDEWGLCLGGATGSGDDTQHVVASDPAVAVDGAAVTLFWSGAGDDVQAAPTSVYNLLHLTEYGAHLPCGADEERGVCVHPWDAATAALSSTTAVGDPWCACTGVAVPVNGDVACQFDGAQTLRLGAALDDPGDCLHPTLGLVCSLRGDCTFNADAVQWGALDITGGGDVVACDCDAPWAGNACQDTLCNVGPELGGDCAADGRGTCDPDPAAPGNYSCTCTPPFYGTHCQYIDAGQAGNATTLECYVLETAVEAPGDDLAAGEWTLCSGRGTCAPSDGDGSTGACTCDAGFVGPQCQYVDCDHEADCGQLGACVQSTDRFGRAETSCRCAVHASSPDTVLGGLVGTDDDATCDVDLCTQGTYTPVVEPVDGVFTVAPSGTCTCITETQTPDPELAYLEVLDGGATLPRHAWLPTLYRANGSSASVPYIPSVYIGNTGLTCAEPVCPLYIDPADDSAASTQCGVTEQVLPHVCLTCEDFPELGMCRHTTGFGGLCDCNGTRALALAVEAAANDGDPETDPDALLPYYYSTGLTRYEDHPAPDNPMCVPYCKNGGSWDAPSRACVCGGTGFSGPSCEDERCVHGTWTPEATGDCTYCDTGWGPVPDCDTCASGYTGDHCADCATGWYRPVPGGECVRCEDTAGCSTVPGAALGAACPDFVNTTEPTCVCGTGYAGATCGACADGYRGHSLFPGQCFQCTPALLDCDDTGAESVLCLSAASSPTGVAAQSCVCTHELMVSATCDACAAGFAKSGAECVACTVALGCNTLGTAAASCPTGREVASDPDAACTCRDGYTGATCSDCDTAGGYVASGGLCTRCDHDCGPYGVPSCDMGLPTCVCTHGRTGAACDACDPDACGPHGTCAGNATHPPEAWCVCDPGTAVNPVTAAADPDNAHTLPCDACAATGYFSPTTQQVADRYDADVGDCLAVADECGADGAVDINATIAAGACVCVAGLTEPDAGSGWACVAGACADGFVGPDCVACPACPTGGACTWTGAAAACVCVNGLTGDNCDDCPAGTLARPPGVSATLVPDACSACPADNCANGTCMWTVGHVVGCACTPPAAHAVRGDVTSSCTGCAPGRSPLTCSACPDCAHGEVCTEATPGAIACECRAGTRRIAGFGTPGIHPCMDASLATAVEAVLGVNLTSVVSAIINGAASTGVTVLAPSPRPVTVATPASASNTSTGTVVGLVAAVTSGGFVVGATVGVFVWWAAHGFRATAFTRLPMGAKAGGGAATVGKTRRRLPIPTRGARALRRRDVDSSGDEGAALLPSSSSSASKRRQQLVALKLVGRVST